MRIFYAVRLAAFCLFMLIPPFVFSQRQESFRGSIPETLLRPARGESPRYPVDVVIGELGRGNASAGAFSFAGSVGSALLRRQMEHPVLASINPVSRESHLSALGAIAPESFRIGSGREEADGSVSFLIRFLGREQGITGEMYIRYITRQLAENGGEARTIGNWVLEELFLEEARNRESENQEFANRFDFNLYERFF